MYYPFLCIAESVSVTFFVRIFASILMNDIGLSFSFFFPVISWFDLGIRVILILWNELFPLLFYFLEEIVEIVFYFFINCLVEFMWKHLSLNISFMILTVNLVFWIYIGLFRLPILYSVLVLCVFQGIFPFYISCWIY